MANHQSSECAICLDKIEVTNCAQLVCGHAIHVHCLVELAKHTNKCPMCRETFYADENRVFFDAWDSVDSESESESDEDMNIPSILDEPDKPDEPDNLDEDEDFGFSRSEVSLLADSTADQLRNDWPRIPNTWPGHRTAMNYSYEFFRTYYQRQSPNTCGHWDDPWALEILKVIFTWYVFYKEAKKTTPQLKMQLYEGVSKQQIVDFMILNGTDFDYNPHHIEGGFTFIQDLMFVYSTIDHFHFNLSNAAIF